MEGLCKYRDALGKPEEGAHAWRVGGLAGVDLLLTAGGALALSRAGLGPRLGAGAAAEAASVFAVFVILIIVAIAVHRLFCVDTALNRRLGLASTVFEAPAGGPAGGPGGRGAAGGK